MYNSNFSTKLNLNTTTTVKIDTTNICFEEGSYRRDGVRPFLVDLAVFIHYMCWPQHKTCNVDQFITTILFSESDQCAKERTNELSIIFSTSEAQSKELLINPLSWNLFVHAGQFTYI